MAATVASISFVVPYANDQLCVSRTEYNDTHEPMKLLPAAQFYCEDGQLNDYVSPRDVALGCIRPEESRCEQALLFFQPSEDSIKLLFHSEVRFAAAVSSHFVSVVLSRLES